MAIKQLGVMTTQAARETGYGHKTIRGHDYSGSHGDELRGNNIANTILMPPASTHVSTHAYPHNNTHAYTHNNTCLNTPARD